MIFSRYDHSGGALAVIGFSRHRPHFLARVVLQFANRLISGIEAVHNEAFPLFETPWLGEFV